MPSRRRILTFLFLNALLALLSWISCAGLYRTRLVGGARGEPREMPFVRLYGFHDRTIEALVALRDPDWEKRLARKGFVRLPKPEFLWKDLLSRYDSRRTAGGLEVREALHEASVSTVAEGAESGCEKYERLLSVDLNGLWPEERLRFGSDVAGPCFDRLPEDWRRRLERMRERGTAAERKNAAYFLGLRAERSGREEEALSLFDEAVQGDGPIVEAWLAQSRIWLARSKRRFEPAISHSYEAARAAYRSNPYDFRTWIEMAGRLAGASQEKQAVELLDQYLAHYQPNQPEVLLKRALLNVGLKRFDEAERDLRRCLEIAPRRQSCRREQVRLSAALRRHREWPGRLVSSLFWREDWMGALGSTLYLNRWLFVLACGVGLSFIAPARKEKAWGAAPTAACMGAFLAWGGLMALGGDAIAPLYLAGTWEKTHARDLMMRGLIPLAAAALLYLAARRAYEPGRARAGEFIKKTLRGGAPLFYPAFGVLILYRLFVRWGLDFDRTFPDATRYALDMMRPLELGAAGFVSHMASTQGAGSALTLAPYLWTPVFALLQATVGKPAGLAVIFFCAPIAWFGFALWAGNRFTTAWIDRETSGWAVPLTLACPLALFYGTFFMTDIPLAAAALLACWLFVEANDRDSLALGVAAGAAVLLAAGMKMTGALVWLALPPLYFTLKKRSPGPALAALATPPLLAFAALSFLAVRWGLARLFVYFSDCGFKLFVSAVSAFIDPQNSETIAAHPDNPPLLFLQTAHGMLGFPLLIFMAAAFLLDARGIESAEARTESRRLRRIRVFLLAWPLFLAAVFTVTQARIYRYALFGFPFFCILGAMGLKQLRVRAGHDGAAAALVVGAGMMVLCALALYGSEPMRFLTINLPPL